MKFVHTKLRKNLQFVLSAGERCVINQLVSFNPERWTREYSVHVQMYEDGRVPIVYETSNSMKLFLRDDRGRDIYEITINPEDFMIKEFGNGHRIHVTDVSEYVPMNMAAYSELSNKHELNDLTISEITKLIYLCAKIPNRK